MAAPRGVSWPPPAFTGIIKELPREKRTAHPPGAAHGAGWARGAEVPGRSKGKNEHLADFVMSKTFSSILVGFAIPRRQPTP